MDLLAFIRSLDDLLYEVVSWLLFFPRTLWRMIRSPLQTMAYAERELREAERKQFDDMIPPPLFLLVTLLLVHVLELGLLGQSNLETVNPKLGKLIGGDLNLTLFRAVAFAILPLSAAAILAKAQGLLIDRQSLKAPFYAQCYAAAIFALIFAISFAFARGERLIDDAGFVILASASILWLYVVEARWFAIQLGTSLLSGFRYATILIAQWLLIVMGFVAVVRWG